MSARNQPTIGDAATRVRAVSRLPLWIGFLGGPTLWSVHLIASEVVVSAACSTGQRGFYSFTLLGTAGWRVVFLLFTAVLLLLAVGADAVAFRSWRATRVGTRLTGEADGAAGRSGWMAMAGILLSSLFLVGIVLEGLPVFWFGGCN